MAKEFSSDAEAALAGVNNAARSYIEANAPGERVTSGEASRLLAQFRVTGDPYAEENLAAVASGAVAKPDYSDPMNLRQYYLNELGVPTALSELQDINNRLNAFDTQTEMTLNNIENKPLRMGVITGEEAATERSRSTTRNSLSREQLAKQSFLDAARQEANSRFSIANAERDKIQSLILETKGQAGISYADSFDTAAKKAGDYASKVAKEEKKQLEKDKLKEMALQFGISTKGKSSSAIRKSIEKLAKTDRKAKKKLEDLEYALKQKELAKPYYEPSSPGEVDTTDKGITTLIQQGYNSGDDWATIAATLTAAGLGTAPGSLADKYLRHKFLGETNPLDEQ